MGLEEEDFTVFTWKLSDYRNASRKTLSPEFSCGGHKWCVALLLWPRTCAQVRQWRHRRVLTSPPRACSCYRNVLLFPMGNSNGQANDMVSV